MRNFTLAFLLLFCVIFSGCQSDETQPSPSAALSSADQAHTTGLFAMDTYMTLTAYGPHGTEALEAAVAEIERLDALLSISSDTGDIKPLNEQKSGMVSEDTALLLSRALEISEETGGLFDPTIAPVMEAWGFPTGAYRVPEQTELDALLRSVDYR